MADANPPGDVRMRGFTHRVTVAAARHWLEQQIQPLPAETISHRDAYRRVLSAPVRARWSVPEFARSAMDGYALRGEETTGASSYQPIPFRIVGQSLPGAPCSTSVQRGECVRIMTGAPIPDGCDTVLPVEVTQEAGGIMEALDTVPVGRHIGLVGEDVLAGTEILPAGRWLRPQDLGLLAAVGVTDLPVYRRPRVRILITGNELVPPGHSKGPYQIVDSNSDMLRALIQRDGGQVESLQRLNDDRELIRAALLHPGADLILCSGGSSVGMEDHAPAIMAAEGELPVHGIAMRPSSPAGMGRIGTALVFLLPGNPVSCLCAYDFFAGRAVRGLGGLSTEWPYRQITARLNRKLVSAVGRVDYARVRITAAGVEPLAISGASILSSTTRADGFVIVPEELEGYPPESEVAVYLYENS